MTVITILYQISDAAMSAALGFSSIRGEFTSASFKMEKPPPAIRLGGLLTLAPYCPLTHIHAVHPPVVTTSRPYM